MNLPNFITLVRIFLVPFFFTELLSHHRGTALGIFVFASITDVLDGYLARKTSGPTELGKFLDPLADKLLLLSGFLGILLVSDFPYTPPLWVTVTVVFRDLFVILGTVIIFLITGTVRIEPNFLGKWATAAQMITLISILLAWKYSFVLWNLTALLTIASCLVYLARDLKKLTLT